MATTVYPRRAYTAALAEVKTTSDHTKVDGNQSGWDTQLLSPDRGANRAAYTLMETVAGPTPGIEYTGALVTDPPYKWITPPVDADVTISGSITFNIWGYENGMAANAQLRCKVGVLRANTITTRNDNTHVEIIDSTRGTELATTEGVNNWSATPGAGVTVNKGDRLYLVILADDVGTMGSGYLWVISTDENTPGNAGDTYITFTETFGFQTTQSPGGTVLYLTDSASDVNPGSAIEKIAWTSRGSGVVSKATNTAAGWTTPIQLTDGGGGSAIEWYTPQLQAFTLAGKIAANVRFARSVTTTIHGRLEVAVVDSTGNNPTVWSDWGGATIISAGETVYTLWASGDDLSVSNGQRLRFRIYIDDAEDTAMTSGQTATFYYAGTTGAASGDTYITLSQSVSEYTGTATEDPMPYITAGGYYPTQG